MRFANIQALRFAAALSVVVYHLAKMSAKCLELSDPLTVALGSHVMGLGVYLFFAISGFVLAHSLRTNSVSQFFLWRAVRLYPAYWVAVAIAMLLARLIAGPIPVTTALARSLLLIPVGPGRAAYMLGGIEWSLVYEVFFSLVLGGLALFGPRRGVTTGTVVWLAACLAYAAFGSAGDVPPHPTWRTIWLSAANVPFLLGVLAYELRGRGREFARLAGPVVVPMLIAAGGLLPRADWALMAQGAGCALAVAWCAAARPLSERNPFVYYGDWTYGLYLSHSVLLAIPLSLGPKQGWLPTTAGAAVAAGTSVVTLGLAYGWCDFTAYRWLRRRWAVRPESTVAPLRQAA